MEKEVILYKTKNIAKKIVLFAFQDGTCGNGWVCQHRWRQVHAMVGFKNAAGTTVLNDWWDNGSNQIAFCRGGNAFIAFNNDIWDLNQNLQVSRY